MNRSSTQLTIGNKEKKEYVLVQQVERRWSNTTNLNQNVLTSKHGKEKGEYQRTKSLCIFYNTNVLSYPKQSIKQNISPIKDGPHQKIEKDLKILQNHEKIMEIQNKWTGNGRFIIKEKPNSFVAVNIKFV
jgi:hypothetical protein